MPDMTNEQEIHLARIISYFQQYADKKYRDGQAAHGGNLWDKFTVDELIDECIKEAIDQVIYLVSLKMKIEGTSITKSQLDIALEDEREGNP